MAITTAQVVCGATEADLNAAETDTVSGSTLILRNSHATDAVAIGATGVAAGTGYQLAAGGTLTISLPPGERLYGIRSGINDITVHVLRLGV